MKKISLIIAITFLFINNVNAQDLTDQLEQLQNNLSSAKDEVTKLSEERITKTYPIGSLYITTKYSSEVEVSNAIGGQWEKYGNGKTLVGVDENDSDFNEVNKNGGNSTITLSTANLPSHTHVIPALTGGTNPSGVHSHNMLYGTSPVSITYREGTIRTLNITSYEWINSTEAYSKHFKTTTDGLHTHTVTTTKSNTESTGSGTSFTNLQPYTTVYMYKRVS